jgi:hypothetical protein
VTFGLAGAEDVVGELSYGIHDFPDVVSRGRERRKRSSHFDAKAFSMTKMNTPNGTAIPL